MAYPLYGNDIDDETTPFEAGTGWTVKMKKGDFVGKKRARGAAGEGADAQAGRLQAARARLPAAHVPRVRGRKPFGEVRSGIVSPSLGDAIGTAYLPVAVAKPGTRFEVEIRGKRLPAEAVPTPFWTKGSRR